MYITKKFLFCLLFLFVPLLAGCLTPPSPPVAASWSDQLAAVERAIPALNDDFIPVESVARPVSCERGAADEPIELRVLLVVQNQKSSQVDEHGNSVYLTRDVHYNDHRLATTMEVDDWKLFPRHPEDPASFERGRSIRFSAHDVLLLTLEEGQAFLDGTVDCTNLSLGLLGMWRTDSSEEEAEALWASSPELNAHALWEIRYSRGNSDLIFLVDAHTGAILKRWEK